MIWPDWTLQILAELEPLSCWWEPSGISQHQNCHEDQIRREVETFFLTVSKHATVLSWGCALVFTLNHHWRPVIFSNLCSQSQPPSSLISWLIGWFLTASFSDSSFLLSCKCSIQQGLGTLESLLFHNMTFSSHILSPPPPNLIQFSATHLSRSLCTRLCVFCSPHCQDTPVSWASPFLLETTSWLPSFCCWQ